LPFLNSFFSQIPATCQSDRKIKQPIDVVPFASSQKSPSVASFLARSKKFASFLYALTWDQSLLNSKLSIRKSGWASTTFAAYSGNYATSETKSPSYSKGATAILAAMTETIFSLHCTPFTRRQLAHRLFRKSPVRDSKLERHFKYMR